jgi:hypothetical protein
MSTCIAADEVRLEWSAGEGLPQLVLCSLDSETPISQSETLVFKSDGWPTGDAARDAGQRYVGALARAFALLRVGVDLGGRAPRGGGFAQGVLESLRKGHGVRVINETPGLMVYESNPRPHFASSRGAGQVTTTRERFDDVMHRALAQPAPLSSREAAAVGCYNASFSQVGADSRLLLLVMAVESLLTLEARSAEAVDHVNDMIRRTKEAETLSDAERQSICSSLAWLRSESIRHGAKRLVAEELGERRYMQMPAADFFARCYDIRSSVVHGADPPPTRMEVSTAAANLELLVAHLLAGELRDAIHA